MTSTQASRRAVFRRIAYTFYYDWPAYTATPLYDRHSLCGLEEGDRNPLTDSVEIMHLTPAKPTTVSTSKH